MYIMSMTIECSKAFSNNKTNNNKQFVYNTDNIRQY